MGWYRELRTKLDEAFLHSFKPSYRKGEMCEVFTNPTSKEYRNFDGSARGFILDDNTVIMWAVYDSLHQTVREELSLPANVIPFVIYGDFRGEVEIGVTDNIRNSDLYHTPLNHIIRENEYLSRAFKDISVSYFDEAIYGSWDELD